MDSIEKIHHKKESESYFDSINSTLIDQLPENPGDILDVGCATGKLGEEIIQIKNPGSYVGIEVVGTVAEEAKKRLTYVYVGQAEEWMPKLKSKSFDWVILADSLEHTVDPWTILEEVNRLLKKEGHILISLPNVRNLGVITELLVNGTWNYRDFGIMDRGHLRFFTKKTILKMLDNYGFIVKKVYSNPRNRWKKLRGMFISRIISLGLGQPSAYEEFITVQWIIVAEKIKNINEREI
ncbi:MAG: SAM-dependent methyltransferase [bacterium]|nr:MAG: SAM-dependent methyltransferase [bacterium]